MAAPSRKRPRHDPQWTLFGMSPTQTPGTRAGWADSIEAAKAAALTAWHMARMGGAGYGSSVKFGGRSRTTTMVGTIAEVPAYQA
jgi:hypothetical protein